MDRFQRGDWLARSLACSVATLVACGSQVSQRGNLQDTANEAGQGSSDSGAAGGSSRVGGTGGTGLTLGGSLSVGDDEAGSASVSGAGVVAVPLLDTTLCENDFVRVDEVPATALFFSGTLDGMPVDVSESAEVAEPPAFLVFRLGPTHVEAISFRLYLADGPYAGGLNVSAADCGVSGSLIFRPHEEQRYYPLASAELVSVTRSVDGFSGLTKGSVFATWISDDGEQHVLQADFALNAVMGDARPAL
jgi:hypothetical protein